MLRRNTLFHRFIRHKNLILLRGAIYFDGSLPQSKRQVRLLRLFEGSDIANQYFLSTKSGIRPIPGCRIRNQYRDDWLPKPAFIVPTVLESLRSLQKYREITHLVPGEADPYCAEDVRKNGGTILTGDSDLVLYDLGSTGGVVFFHDLDVGRLPTEVTAVEIAEGRRLVSAVTYRQSELCRRLSLQPGQEGILPLAFEVKSGSARTIEARASHSSWQYLLPARASEYAEFKSLYQDLSVPKHSIPKYMNVLDPRVSEFVLEWAHAAEAAPMTKEHDSEKRPMVCLPMLVDRWDLLSTWQPSMPIRQLAYSLSWASPPTAPTIIEYGRTLSKESKGQAVDMLGEQQVREVLDGFLGFLDSFIDPAKESLTRLQWITTCLSLEIGHNAALGRESVALKLWQKASKAGGKLDARDWDAVHLTAHIQGTLWSLRMLQQVTKCRLGYLTKASSLTRYVDRLEARLCTLPPIIEFPCASEMGSIFAQLDQAGMLKVLAEYTGMEEPKSTKPSTDDREPSNMGSSKIKKKRHTKQQKQQQKPQGTKSSSANPFDALNVTY